MDDKMQANAYQALLNNPDFQTAMRPYLNQWLTMTPLFSERDIVYQQDRVTLYHYRPLMPSTSSVPLLITYALINRSSILDLQPERSFIRQLLLQGINVYLIDWGSPTHEDQTHGLAQYIHHYLHRAVKTMRRKAAVAKVNLLGVCQGGVFSLCYAAPYQQTIHRLITMVTPIDFQGVLQTWATQIDVQQLAKSTGNVAGNVFVQGLQSLRPLTQPKYLTLFREPENNAQEIAFFLRMEQWRQDCPDHPRQAFIEFIAYFYQQNLLFNNAYFCGKRRVNLSQLRLPILNIYATQDHLIPCPAATALSSRVPLSDYEAVAFDGGHIGVFVSQKALAYIPQKIAQWLAA